MYEYTTVSLDNFFKSQNQLERTIKGGAEVDEKSSILEGGRGGGGEGEGGRGRGILC